MAARLRWQINGQNFQKELGSQEIFVGNTNQPVADDLIRLSGTSISRRHAVIRYDANNHRYTIRDLNVSGSPYHTYYYHSRSDGTLLNKRELHHNDPEQLYPGDMIEVGNPPYTPIFFEVVQTAPARNSSGGFQ